MENEKLNGRNALEEERPACFVAITHQNIDSFYQGIMKTSWSTPLKFPSLLEFDTNTRNLDLPVFENLRTLFGVEKILPTLDCASVWMR